MKGRNIVLVNRTVYTAMQISVHRPKSTRKHNITRVKNPPLETRRRAGRIQ